MKKLLLLFLLPLALLAGCTEREKSNIEESKITEKTDNWNKVDEQNGERPWSGFENAPVEGKNIGFTNPEAAVQDLINAAKAGDITKVHSICSMQAKSPEFRHNICNIQPGSAEAIELQKRFANARISGSILINGDFADVPVVFADNDRDMVRLAMQDGKWYVATVKSYNVAK